MDKKFAFYYKKYYYYKKYSNHQGVIDKIVA